MKRFLFFALIMLVCPGVIAQNQTQTVSGTVRDEASNAPLVGVTIVLSNDAATGTTTDEYGNFRLGSVPIGRRSLKFSYTGYEDRFVSDVVVTAGKEVNLNITMQEAVRKLDEVKIVYDRSKDPTRTNNDMAVVSARSFNIDDTKKYAGSFGDPSRMASNFAGVVSGNDSRNDIVVRGNSPSGMLWRMEDLNIPNPNHFGTLYTTGGPISILNNNNLDKSDFLTSAYPAQYGNALAGVFDLCMRDGNKENYEFVGQVGFNGFEAGAEGPVSRKNQSSFIVNYRYSTLSVFNALGLNFGTGDAIPVYQDVNYKFTTNVGEKGKLSLFGYAGISNINLLAEDIDTSGANLYANAYEDTYNEFSTSVTGLSYQRQFSDNTSSKLTLGYSTTYQSYRADSISYLNRELVFPQAEATFTTGKLSAVWTLLHKFNSRNSIQAGAFYDQTFFDLFNKRIYGGSTERTFVDMEDSYGLAQAYIQWKHRFNTNFSVVSGLHAQYLTLNGTAAIEPRINLRYALTAHHALSVGYGLNHQAQGIYTYFVETQMPGGIAYSNKDLGFTRSSHFVAAYDWNITDNTRLKLEGYYQYLDKVPVSYYPGSYSALNSGASFAPDNEDSLVNKGTGTNYGLELTLERFFSKGYYFLITGSLFDSKYIGSDGVERNTAFNTNYVLNVLAGKEFKLGNKGNVLALNVRASTVGGKYFTPIDFAATAAEGEMVVLNDKAYSERQDPYLRIDFKISYRKEFKKSTLEISLDLQNVTDNKNIFSRGYDPRTNKVYYNYQQGFFPIPFMRYTF